MSSSQYLPPLSNYSDALCNIIIQMHNGQCVHCAFLLYFRVFFLWCCCSLGREGINNTYLFIEDLFYDVEMLTVAKHRSGRLKVDEFSLTVILLSKYVNIEPLKVILEKIKKYDVKMFRVNLERFLTTNTFCYIINIILYII